jgi:hypothetical protein
MSSVRLYNYLCKLNPLRPEKNTQNWDKHIKTSRLLIYLNFISVLASFMHKNIMKHLKLVEMMYSVGLYCYHFKFTPLWQEIHTKWIEMHQNRITVSLFKFYIISFLISAHTNAKTNKINWNNVSY